MSRVKFKNEKTVKKDEYLYPQIVCGIWVFLMLVVFPVFMHDAYFDVLNTKYMFCIVVDLALIFFMGIWAALHWKQFCEPFKKKLNALDIAMIALGAVYIIATLVSDYKEQSFFGNEGRFGGMALYCLYVTSYLLVSRFWKFNKPTFRWFLLACLFVGIFGITDFFKCDIFGYKLNIDDTTKAMFSSTIGNIDTLTSFLAIPMAYAGAMMITTKEDRLSVITYAVAFFILVWSVITARADNAYLGFIAYFGLMPFIAFKTRQGFRRYILELGLLFSALTLTMIICRTNPEGVYVPSGVFTILSSFSTAVFVAAAVFMIAGIGLCIWETKNGVSPDALMPSWVRWAWLAVVILVGGAVVAILVVANTNFEALPDIFKEQSRILVLDNGFGGGRGYTWMATMDIWKNNLPWYQKLFGAGPETSGIYMINLKYDEMVAVTHLIFDSPHNEFLQMFFNLGIVGVIVYIGTFVTTIVMCLRNKASQYYPYCVAIAFIVLCHMFECVVNIVVPIDCGLLFAFIALAGYFMQQREQ